MATSSAKVRPIEVVEASLPRRYRSERIFKSVGLGAIVLGVLFVSLLFVNIVTKGYSAFLQTHIALDVNLNEQIIDPSGARDRAQLARADYLGLIKESLRKAFPSVDGRREKRDLYKLVSSGASFQLADRVTGNPELIGTTRRMWLVADDEIDMLIKGYATDIESTPTAGIASPTGTEGRIKVLSTANDFAPILAQVKDRLRSLADKEVRRLDRKQGALTGLGDELARLEAQLTQARAAADTANAARLEGELGSLRQRHAAASDEIAAIQQRATDLRVRADTPGGEEVLPPQLPSYLVSINGGLVKANRVSNSAIEGEVFLPLDAAGEAPASTWEIVAFAIPEDSRRLKDRSVAWVWDMQRRGLVERKFNSVFFTAGDSREPELAGIGGAVMGSVYTLLVTLLLSFPIGVAAAVYLEEFAPKNRWTDLIEVNINNLAAVPSIVFGLLGLAVFINFFGLPRSAPLVGGLVLTLMTLPTVIIASRAALKSVPPSIREAALGVGASRMQAMTHHVLPLAMPGMLTGAIIGMAQALGESAPLLMIGMVAFIVDIPGGAFDPSTVLPVQIFLWAESPERAFVERTSAAIMVLLAFLIVMNAFAVIMRRRFERRW